MDPSWALAALSLSHTGLAHRLLSTMGATVLATGPRKVLVYALQHEGLRVLCSDVVPDEQLREFRAIDQDDPSRDLVGIAVGIRTKAASRNEYATVRLCSMQRTNEALDVRTAHRAVG